MTPEQEIQLRFNLVMNNKPHDREAFELLKEMYTWVVGNKSTIIPATAIKVQK